MNTSQALRYFGFTRQESKIYLTLLRYGALTGYEAAKRAGISRSNAYSSLASLTAKGGARKSEERVPKFHAVPKEELLTDIWRKVQDVLSYSKDKLPDPLAPETPYRSAYVTITGYENVVNKIIHLMDDAKESLWLEIPGVELWQLKQETARTIAKGIDIMILSDREPEGVEKIDFHRKEIGDEQVKVIVDEQHVLTGSLLRQESDQCMYSRNMHMVELLKKAFLNDIT